MRRTKKSSLASRSIQVMPLLVMREVPRRRILPANPVDRPLRCLHRQPVSRPPRIRFPRHRWKLITRSLQQRCRASIQQMNCRASSFLKYLHHGAPRKCQHAPGSRKCHRHVPSQKSLIHCRRRSNSPTLGTRTLRPWPRHKHPSRHRHQVWRTRRRRASGILRRRASETHPRRR